MDLALVEDVVEVERTKVNPDAIVAPGHGVGCDSRMVPAHIILYHNDL
jgi:hypothetical protein